MGLYIYSSSSVNRLTDKIGEVIKENSYIFIPDFVLTSNSGINNWLKIALAKKNEISANILFSNSDEFINIVYSILNDSNSSSKMLNKSILQWKIFEELDNESFIKKYPKKYNYYSGNEIRKYELSKKIAGLIDRYQMRSNDLFQNNNDWQTYLWDLVQKSIGEEFITRAQMKESIEKSLESINKQQLLLQKIPAFHLFLDIDFTPYHFSVFSLLSKYIDVNIYFFNPLKQDSAKGNELVDNWSKKIKEVLNLFGDNQLIELYPKKESNIRGTLLSKLQTDILLSKPSSFTIEDLKDDSIIINNCFTPSREIEVLYNYLIKTISESEGDIGARDILVMAPNIDKYAASIKGIFDSAPRKLPYSISDSSYGVTDSVYVAIEAILVFEDSYKADSVLQLIDLKFIKEKFQFANVDLLKSFISRANIKFGIDGDKTIETNTVSWRHGLRRLIYGYCMGNTNWFSDNNDEYLLVDMVEGGDANELIRLNSFIELLVDTVNTRKQQKTMNEWVDYLNELVDSFIHQTDENRYEIAEFQRKLAEVKNYSYMNNRLIDYNVFKILILDLIASATNHSNYASKGITFCSMQQNRNVPYKIIAVLGMNFRDFPRKETLLSYDLIQKDSENELSTKSEDDNYLFLQVLMSAKERMYLSYIGKNIKDNTNIPPSSIIDDLLDYIKDSSNSDFNMVCSHPLHSFSRKYFDGENPMLYNYIYDEPKLSEDKVIVINNGEEDLSKINIKDFIDFFKNPFRHYYRHQLGVYYTGDEGVLQETELFELDHLQKWSLKNQLVSSSLELEQYRKEKVESGELPLSRIGKVNLDEVEDDVAGLRERLDVIIGEYKDKERIPINILVEEFQLSGFVNQIYRDKYVNIVVSKDTRIAKYLVEFYINTILLIASESNIEKYFVSYQGNYDMSPVDAKITKEKAKEKLQMLIDYYQKGKKDILAFSTEFSWQDLLKFSDFEETELRDKTNELYKNDYTSKEYKMEYNAGFFNKGEILDELKENTMNIIEIITNLE